MATVESDVDIRWDYLGPRTGRDRDPRWRRTGCLYAYLHEKKPDIFYLGKAWGVTVRRRWDARDKLRAGGLWDWYEQSTGSRRHVPMIGEIHTATRLTAQLLEDLESLLIHAYQPGGNIRNSKSRGSHWREGLIVRNLGRWPYKSARVVIDSVHEVVVRAALRRH